MVSRVSWDIWADCVGWKNASESAQDEAAEDKAESAESGDNGDNVESIDCVPNTDLLVKYEYAAGCWMLVDAEYRGGCRW